MKTKILMVFALFLMLTGFYEGDSIVEQSGVNLQEEVVDEDEAPEVVRKPVVRVKDQGKTLLLEVKVSTSVNSIQWFHDGKEIDVMNNKYNTSFRDNVATLVIRNVDERDAGIYKVIFKNKAGECAGIIKLVFNEDV